MMMMMIDLLYYISNITLTSKIFTVDFVIRHANSNKK